MNSTICWNISHFAVLENTIFSQTSTYTNFQKQPINKQYLVIFGWLLPFLGGRQKTTSPKIHPKKTSSNSEVPERWIHLGLRWGADVSLAGRGLRAGQRSYSKSYHHWSCFFKFCRKAWDFLLNDFLNDFFLNVKIFCKLLRLNRTSNVEEQLKSWQINGKTLEKNGKSGSFLTFSLCLEDNPFHNYVDGQKP